MTLTLDVRRHAERATAADAPAVLSPAGTAMARRIARDAAAFALVVSSPRDRARATAIAIGGRVDEVEPLLGGSPDDALTQEQYDAMDPQRAVAELLRTNAASRRFAEERLALRDQFASRLSTGSALVITHGGNIELPAVLLAAELGAGIAGDDPAARQPTPRGAQRVVR